MAGAQSPAPQKISIVLPKPDNPEVPVNFYIVQMIEEALATENITATVSYSKEPMNEKRAIYSLQNNHLVNLYWLSTNTQLERDLRAIKIPLYKGLNGKRILLIHRELAPQFAAIKTLEQLKAYVGLQQQSWSDYQILVDNGLNIDGSQAYHAMYKALNNKLGDYFPRSVLMVRSEYQNNQSDDIIIEPTLLLSYPNDYYFFLNKDNQQLASQLETGLNTLIANGRFEEIFSQHFAQRLQGLNLPERHIIYLKK